MFNIVNHFVHLGQQKRFALTVFINLEFAQMMAQKNERIGLRVSGETKAALLNIAIREGRSLAQVCELLLKGGILEYEKDGTEYIRRLLIRVREKSKSKD